MALNNLTRVTSSGFGTNTNINTTGIITAASFSGDGSGLTGITALGSGVVVQEEGSNVGTAQTINFIGTGVTATFSGGVASVEITTSSGGGGGGLSNVVEDTTPQLGGNLDLNSNNITGTGDINITGDATFSGDLDVDGHVDLDNVSIAGIVTVTATSGQHINLVNGSSTSSIAQSGNNLQVINYVSGGELNLSGDKVYLQARRGTLGNYVWANSGSYQGSVVLAYQNASQSPGPKLWTTSDGVNVSGHVEADQLNVSGVATATSFSGDGSALTGLTGASAATYGNGTVVPQITVDANGRITTITNVSISGGGGGGGTTMFIRDSGSLVGAAGTIDFGTNLNVSPVSAGVVTVTAAGSIPGISTSGTTELNNLTVAGVSTFTGSVTINDNTRTTGDFRVGNISDGTNSNAGLLIYGTSGLVISNNTGSGGGYYLRSSGTSKWYVDYQANQFGTGTFKLGPNISTPNTTLDTSGNASFSGILTATSFSGDGSALTNLPASGISTAFTNVQATWSLGANGTSAYRFTGPGNDGTEDNPDIYLVRGQKYRFTNNTGGSHPFEIRSSAGGSAYSDGVTNNNAASGNIEINVQHDAPARLFYQCSSHSGMVGNIYVVGGSDWRMTDVNTSTDPEIYTDRYVGIGTDNPLMALHVHGAANSADSRIRLSSAEGSGLTIRAQSATENNINADGGEDITFSRGNVESLRINSSGYVGIGTDNPGYKLDVRPTPSDPTSGSPPAGAFLQIRGDDATVGSGPSLALLNLGGTKETAWRISAVSTSGNNGDLVFNGYAGGATYPEVARFTSAGNLKFPSGQGIDFSADGNASGNQSEVLNDYEEGYASVTMTCGTSGTITLSNDEVSYVKVGDLVNIHGRLDVSSVSSPNGELIVNLPFNAANEGNGSYASHSAVSLFIWSANSGAGYSQTGLWVGWISPNDNKIRIRYGNSATPAGSGAGGMQAGTEVRFTATFRTV